MTQPDPDPLTIPDFLRRDKRLPRAAIEALTSSSIDWAPIRKIESYQKDDVPAIFVENRKAPVQVNLRSKPNAKKRGAKGIAEYPSFDAFLKAHDFQRYPVSQTFVLSNEDISIVAVLDRWPSKAKKED